MNNIYVLRPTLTKEQTIHQMAVVMAQHHRNTSLTVADIGSMVEVFEDTGLYQLFVAHIRDRQYSAAIMALETMIEDSLVAHYMPIAEKEYAKRRRLAM